MHVYKIPYTLLKRDVIIEVFTMKFLQHFRYRKAATCTAGRQRIMSNKAPSVAVSAILLAVGFSATFSQGTEEGHPRGLRLNLNDSTFFWASNNSDYGSSGPLHVYSTRDNSEQGYVNLGALQSFTANLTAQEKEDILDSILLAQLTASRMYDRETKYTKWYAIYVKALIKLGWMVDSYRFFQYTPPRDTINLAEDTLRLIKLLCAKPELQLEVTEKVLVAYRDLLSSDPRVQMFNNHTMHTESSLQASFQILPAAEVWDGVTSLVFSNFHFSSGEHNHRYLSHLWSASSVKLRAAISVGSLNHKEYAVCRQAVKNNLGNAMMQFVKEIQLQ